LLASSPDDSGLHLLMGICRQRAGDLTGALQSFVRAEQLDASALPPQANTVVLLAQMQRAQEAATKADAMLAAFPGEQTAQRAAGEAYLADRRYREALACFDQVLAGAPADVIALIKRGFALAALKDYQGAREAFAAANRANPDAVSRFCAELSGRPESPAELNPEAIFLWTRYLALCACDWRSLEETLAEFARAIDSGSAASEPALAFVCALLPTRPDQRHALARGIAARIEARCAPLPAATPGASRGPIRIGLLSPDFREHLNAYLLLPLLELGDRGRFEYYAYSTAPDDGSGARAAIGRAAHRLRDLQPLGDRAAAEQIRRDGIDVLVDVGGYTAGARFGITAHRPAPVQASYLGFSATLGSARVDYVIADPVVLPEEDEPYWSEAPVRLPTTFFLYDFRTPPLRTARREDYGLPTGAFVFSAFHRAEKVEPRSFGLWMEILRAVPESLLWLYASHERMPANVLREAQARGVDPARLRLVPRAPRGEYLARFRLADLQLDSLVFNATTTACDALAAGVPLLTARGGTFPARTAESLLRAAGLPELVARDEREFVARACAFARAPESLAPLRERLARNRASAPLFDTAARVHELETAFAEMTRRARAGLRPVPFRVLAAGAVA
jgi:predicted O-linked N-acetylglucosamine transferase (SPINDLY family)